MSRSTAWLIAFMAMCVALEAPAFAATLPETAGLAARQAGDTAAEPAAPRWLRKRGIGWGLNGAAQVQTLKGMTWWYNWGSEPEKRAWRESVSEGVEFVPMQWARWGIDKLNASIPEGARVLLGPNEPNHQLEAGMTPAEVAELWPVLEAAARAHGGLRLGSPAPAPCGAQCIMPNPFDWLDEFFKLCEGCKVDFIATHYYACNPGWLQAYLRQAQQYGLPVWLTEFACPAPYGPPSLPYNYMVDALTLLDQDSKVERYAWFALSTADFAWLGLSNSLMDMDTGRLTPLGRLYLSFKPPAPGDSAQAHSSSTEGHSTDGKAAGGATAAAAATRSAGSSSAGDSGDVQEQVVQQQEKSWAALCQPCIEHLKAGRALDSLDGEQRRYCSHSCGFWPSPMDFPPPSSQVA